MIKNIDEIMYISDNINPFREGLIYGHGGLGYKPTKYNMIGGTLTNELNIIGLDKSELEKMTYEELQELLNENYGLLDEGSNKNLTDESKYDYDQLLKETQNIEKLIDKKEREELTNNIEDNESSDNDDYEYYKSDDFLDQMKWYEDNLDNLDEDELFVYMHSLAKLKEIENKENGITNDFTDLDKKLYKIVKEYEIMTGKESEYKYEDKEDYERELDPFYIPEIEPDNYKNILISSLREFYENKYKTPEEKKLLYQTIGDKCEEFYSDKKKLFTSLNKNKDTSDVFNTSDVLNPNYSSRMKIVGKQSVIITGKKKQLSDLYLVDFVSDKNLYEMKTLKDSYQDFYNKKSIHLVGTKIAENLNYKANFVYDDKQNKVVVENIGYRKYYNSPVEFNTLSNKNYNYTTIFVLSDGIYSCNMSNPKLWNIDKMGKAKFKFLPDKYNNVHIPLTYIERVDTKIVDEINN